ncbi:MAG: beta-ketoacyl synthase N-terminal-like domain-containing protein, partial [Planctomycetota bacterium]
MDSARVVITGLGAATPLGLTADDTWAGLCAGKVGIDTITAFDPVRFECKLAGQVPDYKIRNYMPKSLRKAVKLMSRDIELSIIAANDAVVGAGLVTKGIDPDNINVDPERMAINLGAGLISCDLEELAPAVAASLTDGKFDIHKWGKEGLEQVTPLWLLK